MTARLYLSRALRRQKEGKRERKEKDDGTIVANQGHNTMGERGRRWNVAELLTKKVGLPYNYKTSKGGNNKISES